MIFGLYYRWSFGSPVVVTQHKQHGLPLSGTAEGEVVLPCWTASHFLQIVLEGNYTVLKWLYGHLQCHSCCLENKNETGPHCAHVKIIFTDLSVTRSDCNMACPANHTTVKKKSFVQSQSFKKWFLSTTSAQGNSIFKVRPLKCMNINWRDTDFGRPNVNFNNFLWIPHV